MRAMLAWSGGKDSAWALHLLRQRGVEVAGLFATVDEATERVPIHEVGTEFIAQQAEAASLALHTLPLPSNCPNAIYESVLAEFTSRAKGGGTTHLAFGDLFLEDIRRYRERQFAASGLQLLFPLWGMPTRALAEQMTESGLRAWITSVDTTQAPEEWAGRVFDRQFVKEIPAKVDPCGENGEFHTFVFRGPMFARALATRPGRLWRDERWAYADILHSEGDPVPA